MNVTASPTTAWIWQQVMEATPWGRQPRYLLRDRDAVSTEDLVQRTQRRGIQTLLSPVRGLRASAMAESVIRTLRNECRDHLIIVNEQHLWAAVTKFVQYYNTERPHRCLLLDTPRLPSVPGSAPSTRGPFSAACITSMSVQAEQRSFFAPTPLGRPRIWVGLE